MAIVINGSGTIAGITAGGLEEYVVNATVDTMTGDNSDVTLALSVAPGSENNVQITFDGVTQHHSTFSLAGSTITFATAPGTGVAVEAITGGSSTTGTPDNDTVDGTKLADNACDSEHYTDGSIDLVHLQTGTDGELITWNASGNPAAVPVGTATHVLTSGGAGVAPTFQAPAAGSVLATAGAYAYRAANQTIATATTTKVAWDTELYDIGGDFDSTTNNRYTVASGEAGKYFVTSCLNINVATDGTSVQLFLYKNGQQLVRTKNVTGNSNNLATVALTTVVELAAADYLEVYAHHTKGSNADIGGNVNRNWFIITRFD